MSMIGAIFSAIFFILLGQRTIAKGFLLGTLFSVLNFIVIGEILPLILGKSRNRTVALSLLSILFRFGLLSIPLILALKMDELNFAASVIGIFMVQLTIMSDHLLQSLPWPGRNRIYR
jgi:hypothetical protein